MLTWPALLHGRSQLPVGEEPVRTVPLFNLWTLEWNAQRLVHAYRGYWDAPIFHPSTGAFARSEAQPLTGVVHAVLRPLLGAPGSYVAILIGFIALNALAGATLARRLGVPSGACLLAGVLMGALPFVGAELGVLQLAPVFPIVFALERILALGERCDQGRGLGPVALGLGGWVGVTWLLSGYYGLFVVLAAALVGAVVLVGRARLRELAGAACLALALALALAAPFSLAQQRITSEERWSLDMVGALSARPSMFVAHAPGAHGLPGELDPQRTGQGLGVGWVALALGAFGLVAAVRGQRRAVVALVALVVGFALLAMGLRLSLWGWQPYRLLYDHVPGFDRLRSPFRFVVVAQVAVLALAGLGLGRLWGRFGRPGQALAVLLTGLVVLSAFPLGARLDDVPVVEGFDWVRHLREAPDGAVAMVPFPPTGSVVDYDDTTVAMLAGLEHGHPLVNGYTGLFPSDYLDLRQRMLAFPTPGAAAALRDHDVRYVVIWNDWLGPARRAGLVRAGYAMEFAGTSRSVWVDERPSG